MKRLSIMCTGIYNFDTIVQREYPEGPQKQRTFKENELYAGIGGTCGNVACMTSYLGADTYPIAQFDQSEQGFKLKADMEKYGCDTRFVENIPNGGTVLLRCTHKLNAEGEHTASFRATGPASRFARRKHLRAKDEAPAFLEKLDFTPDVYFFDCAAAGNRALAEGLRQKGTLVYFEPENEDNLKKAVAVSDIVKFSGEKVTDTSFCNEYQDKLFIQTLGANGLQFSLRGGEWVKVDPVPVDNVVDWEGCGDTTSSVFICQLGEMGTLKIGDMTEETVKKALEAAVAKAALCTQYMGSLGWVNAKR